MSGTELHVCSVGVQQIAVTHHLYDFVILYFVSCSFGLGGLDLISHWHQCLPGHVWVFEQLYELMFILFINVFEFDHPCVNVNVIHITDRLWCGHNIV